MALSPRGVAAALILLLPLPLFGQGDVGLSIGSRAYRSGPVLTTEGAATLRPVRAVEYMAHVQLARSKGVTIGLIAGGFTADFVTESPGAISIGLKDLVSGYGGRLTAEVPVRTSARGAVLGIRVEGGLESFVLRDTKSQLRGVVSAGPTLRVPLMAQWDLNLSALGGTLLSSPFTAEGLPEETTNRNPWWITWRIGIVRRLGGQ